MGISNLKVREAILFSYDIVGYTSLCDQLEIDGEYSKAWELTSKVTSASNDIIRSHGGVPHSFTGDGYIASFNGNAYRRSIDTALDVQNLASELNDSLDMLDDSLRLKVALYKGTCLFGNLENDEYTPLGRAPSKLTRLQDMARPGEIIASGSVIDPVIGAYDVDLIPGIKLRGIQNQRTIYRVRGSSQS